MIRACILNNENLHYELPQNIVVRCYDWGANGTLKVTIEKKIGNKWKSEGNSLTHRIPFDENENGIADSWETEASLKVVLPNSKKGYDPGVDNEKIEKLLDKKYYDGWPGDGWTIGDEYRGAFLESTDTEVTRLNPMRKEVIVSPEDTDDPKDMWYYGTGSYRVPEHDLVLMHPTSVKKPFDNYKGLFGVKKDVGQVNFNSDRKRVYAIRIEKGGTHAVNPNIAGSSPLGSPAPESKVIIYVTGIRTTLSRSGERLNLTKKQLQDAVDVAIGTTFSHEIGHSLDLSHCFDKTCLMYSDPDETKKTKKYEWTPFKRLRSLRDGFKRHKVNEHYYAVTGSAIAKWVNTYIYIDVDLDDDGADASPTLTPSNGLYTASAGDSHTAKLSASSPYSLVYWYLKSPSDTSASGKIVEIDKGDGSSTSADMTYTFASDAVAGAYVITAYVYPVSGEVSIVRYTVTLSSGTVVPPVVVSRVPGVPTGLTSTASNGKVKVSWTAPTDDGGGIDNYQYRVDKNSDGSWGGWINVASGSTSVDVSVENGVDYAFQVRSKNSAGSSTSSVKSTALPIDSSVSTPSVPRNLSATADAGYVRLSWEAPATGTPVIAYEYTYDKGNDGSWRSWKLTKGTGTSYAVTGLTNGTTYAFKVRARNIGGIGTESSKVTVRLQDTTIGETLITMELGVFGTLQEIVAQTKSFIG